MLSRGGSGGGIHHALVHQSRGAHTHAGIHTESNRIINVAFKFIPLRAGVDEGGTGQVSKVLGFARGIGETLAIVRKGRDIFWSAIGLLLIWKKATDYPRNPR